MKTPVTKTRQLSISHMVGAAAAVLGLIFVLAFGAKVLEAIRLRNWSDRLAAEVQQLERDHADWEQQLARSGSDSSLARELLESGWVRDDLVVSVVVTATPAPVTEQSEPVGLAAPVSADPVDAALFRNEHWYAWRRLIGGFD